MIGRPEEGTHNVQQPLSSILCSARRLREMTWAAAALATDEELREPAIALDTLLLPPLNASMLSPCGLAVELSAQPARVVHLTAGGVPVAQPHGTGDWVALQGRVVGGDIVRALRGYPLVMVDELSWQTPYQVAVVVVSLALAGVPVATAELSPAVRSMIDAPLLDLSDVVAPETVRDPYRRESVSIAIRRRAHRAYGFHVLSDPAHPPVSVVVQAQEPARTAVVLDAVARQSWPNVHVHVVADPEEAVAARAALRSWPRATSATSVIDRDSLEGDVGRVSSVYLTRIEPTIAYGPHHLEDLVHALRHSGAPVAHSRSRFSYDAGREVVLEAPGAAGEGPGDDGLAGASLWYADDGLDGSARPGGYLVHGCNVVALERRGGLDAYAEPTTQFARGTLPPQLSWFGGWQSEEVARTVGCPSYFARSNMTARV